jgi:hypothetical protein
VRIFFNNKIVNIDVVGEIPQGFSPRAVTASQG